jgi:hypothetical protein
MLGASFRMFLYPVAGKRSRAIGIANLTPVGVQALILAEAGATTCQNC